MLQANLRRWFMLFSAFGAALSARAVTLAPLAGGMEMTAQFVNNSAYPDNQVYILITARNGANQPCFVNAAGVMTPIVGGQNASMYAMTLNSFTALQFPPVMTSARLWISYGAPMDMATFAGGGIAQPNLGNPGDPNINTVFDWMEFNVGGGQFFGNTTQVDMLGIPYTMELYDDGGGLNSRRGIEGCFADIKAQYLAFMDGIPGAAAFKGLAGAIRIVAPAHGSFAAGQPNGNYFDAYIASVWAGPYRPAGIAQPSTQDVLLATGPLATQAAVNAALNRHVADHPGGYNVTSAYYQTGPANYYAAFWHQISLGGAAYGFAYDDANDQSSLQVSNSPRALVIQLGGCVPTPTPTATRSGTRSPTPSFSPTPTRTATSTVTRTLTATRTPTATSSVSASASPSPSITGSGTASATATATPSLSASPSATVSATVTFSATGTVTGTASATVPLSASATVSVSASTTATLTASRTSSLTFTGTRQPSMTASATASPTDTLSASPTKTPSPSPTPSPFATEQPSPWPSSSITPSLTPNPVATATPSPTALMPARFFQQERLILVKGLYPNPFVDTLKVYFTLRVEAAVQLHVFNVAGEPVWSSQAEGKAGANLLTWNGENGSQSRCATGIYVLRLQAHGIDGTRDTLWEQAAVAR